jgi:GNAT superfamily N-acetyltransferase
LNEDIALTFQLRRAAPEDSPVVAVMVGELLNEIMTVTGAPFFNFNLDETIARLEDFLLREKYFVFIGCSGDGREAGFVALYESHALYAEGAFGTIPELYVRPEFRAHGIGRMLVDGAKAFGVTRGWTRLEVTTPPLPQFDRTLAFYERENFTISGGRKLKAVL